MATLHQKAVSGAITMNEYKKRMANLSKATAKFFEEEAQFYADDFLNSLQQATPVKTGKLRDGWKLELSNYGQTFTISATNNMYYAPFVEYGHIARDNKTWVMGAYMLTNTAKHYERAFDYYFGENMDYVELLNLTKRASTKFSRKYYGQRYDPNYNRYMGIM